MSGHPAGHAKSVTAKAHVSSPLEVGIAPPEGQKIAHPVYRQHITDPGFDDSKSVFKNTVQRTQMYQQKRNLPTHRVLPRDVYINAVAYGLTWACVVGSAWNFNSLATSRYPKLG